MEAFFYALFPALTCHFLLDEGEMQSRIVSALTSLTIIANLEDLDLTLSIYLIYLAQDTLRHRLTFDIALHHAIACLLVLIGLNAELFFEAEDVVRVRRICIHLLSMEVTTPVLHAAWIFRELNQSFLSVTGLIVLIAMWPYFRIVNSLYALAVWYTFSSVTLFINAVIFVLIGATAVLQTWWFFKLCSTLHSAVIKMALK